MDMFLLIGAAATAATISVSSAVMGRRDQARRTKLTNAFQQAVQEGRNDTADRVVDLAQSKFPAAGKPIEVCERFTNAVRDAVFASNADLPVRQAISRAQTIVQIAAQRKMITAAL